MHRTSNIQGDATLLCLPPEAREVEYEKLHSERLLPRFNGAALT